MERGEGSPYKAGVCSGSSTVDKSHHAAPKAKRAGPSAEQRDLGEKWSHVVRGGGVVKTSAPLPTPTPKPIPQSVTKAPKLPQVTATDKKAKPEKAELNTKSAPKKAAVKPKKTTSAGAKPVRTPKPVANLHPFPSSRISLTS